MPNFIILRVQREDNPANRDECVVKFYPIKRTTGENFVIPATDEANAFAIACFAFPTFRRFLAVEPESSYTATVARLLAARIQRELAAKSKGAKIQAVSGRKDELGRDYDVREFSIERPRPTADQTSNPA